MMKSILFVLLMTSAGTDTRPVSVFESIEQCRDAQARYASNVAAEYKCAPANTSGTWTRKSQAYLAKQ